MTLFRCTCGLDFKDKLEAEDHEILNHGFGFTIHHIHERTWKHLLKDLFFKFPWKLMFRIIGLNYRNGVNANNATCF